jgi:phage terminase large subunit
LKSSADWDENYYRIFYLGEWGELEGLIFNWDVVPLPTDIAFDEISHGGDFGYSVDPAALVRLYRKADEFWVQLLLYERKLTNIQLGERMLSMGFTNRDITVWDSAEPKSIQELYNLGLNAIPARKGPDSVKHSYDLAKSLKIHIVESTDNYDSEPLIREVKGHVYKKDKDGNSTNEPIEINNHAIKAVLYALHTLYNNQPTDANRLRGGIALRHETL